MLKRNFAIIAMSAVSSIYAAGDMTPGEGLFPGLGSTVFFAPPTTQQEQETMEAVAECMDQISNDCYSYPVKGYSSDVSLAHAPVSGLTLTMDESGSNYIISSLIFAPKHHITVRGHNIIIQGCIVGLSVTIESTGSVVLYNRKPTEANMLDIIQGNLSVVPALYPSGSLGSVEEGITITAKQEFFSFCGDVAARNGIKITAASIYQLNMGYKIA